MWPAPELAGPDLGVGASHGRVRSWVPPPAARLHPDPRAPLCTRCALPAARGVGACGGRAGSPPDEGAECLEGSRVSCQPVIQLQTPVLNETFGEMDTSNWQTGRSRWGSSGGGGRGTPTRSTGGAWRAVSTFSPLFGGRAGRWQAQASGPGLTPPPTRAKVLTGSVADGKLSTCLGSARTVPSGPPGGPDVCYGIVIIISLLGRGS